jgi:hypothetical protein
MAGDATMSETYTGTLVDRLIAVKKDVGAVRKDATTEGGGGQARYNFRGIDAVINAVAPQLIKHGVIVYPELLDVQRNPYTTSRGANMSHYVVQVAYTFTDGHGEPLRVVTPGEAFDSGDKGLSKAMSVAYRTALIQALSLPTDEKDPDAEAVQAAPATGEPQRTTTVRRTQRARPTPAEPPLEPAEKGGAPDLTGRTRSHMFALFAELGIDDATVQRAGMERILGRDVESRSTLTEAEGRAIVDNLLARKRARDGDENFPPTDEPPLEES